MYAAGDGYVDLRYGPPLGAGPDYRNVLTTHPQLLSLPRSINAGIPGLRSEIPQQDGCDHGLDQGYYPGELQDGPDCRFPLPFSVDEANAAHAPDSCGSHFDATIEEKQASPWSTSQPISRAASSALNSAGSSGDDMEWAVDLGWTTSEVGSPSQFLESSDMTGLDGLATSTSCKAAPQVASPTEKQQPVDDVVLARDTKPEPAERVSAPPTSSLPGRTGINAASQSFYGLRDAVCRSLDKNQHVIARALAAPGDKTSNTSGTADLVPAGESYPYDGSWWTLESDAALQAYIAAFSDYFYSFIPKTAIEARVREARLPDASHLVRGFASAVLALGAYYHHLCRRQHGDVFVAGSGAQKQNQKQKQHSCSRNGDSGHLDGAQASWRLRGALAFRGPYDLQASIASECDLPSLVTENVAIAVMHVRELDLVQMNADDEESALSSAYSYVLDVSHALDRGAPPMLDCDWMDGSSPSDQESEQDLLGIRSLAAVMHRCLRRQFSPRASYTYSSEMVIPGGGRRQSHWESQDQLRHWVELFPGLKLRITPGNNGGLPTSTARLAFCMYHRAVFLTHCPWIAATAGLDSEPVLEHDHDALGRGCCIRACLESAQQLIDAIPCFFSTSSSGTKLERQTMEDLVLASLFLIIYCKVNRDVPGEHRRKAVALAGLCHGSLARISLDESDVDCDDDSDGQVNSDGHHLILERIGVLVSIADRCNPT
ncbi:Integral membrane protein duf6 [Colletotrichum higginsianum IMI 349063]|uniref:Integral membrane protein duf6 n=1 Tax=Colletotrichum higginsianum (strain IMI 349063) TaxID=759273 RepID=A0A1B7YCL8_COLHI|nr:Integral membrane protein duf6 [Colletotrichum higginsianum IMI 349063]OBR09590.1 Integral membrane protein duf6 [Colletotrichum higginsianum IMI 349063]